MKESPPYPCFNWTSCHCPAELHWRIKFDVSTKVAWRLVLLFYLFLFIFFIFRFSIPVRSILIRRQQNFRQMLLAFFDIFQKIAAFRRTFPSLFTGFWCRNRHKIKPFIACWTLGEQNRRRKNRRETRDRRTMEKRNFKKNLVWFE